MSQDVDKTEDGQEHEAIVDKILRSFFDALESKPELLEISAGLKKEKIYSETNIRRILFGDES